MIIGITGKPGSGKDTLAESLEFLYNFKLLRFSTPIYEMLKIAGFNIDADKDEPQAHMNGVTLRYAAQTLGSEWGRHRIGSQVWANKLESRINPVGSTCIVDIRYENEANIVRDRGGFIVHLINNNSYN